MKAEVDHNTVIERCLKPTPFMDSEEPSIVEFARRAVGDARDDVEKGVRLFYAVRDSLRYNPYGVDLTPEGFRASVILAKKEGYCVAKAIVLATVAKAVSIPSRLGFANVRNHLVTERLRRYMDTDIFYYHGYTELYLAGKWVKATPTFNLSLCERFGVKPLDFDGYHDALFHEFDSEGSRHMEYICYHGVFEDVPFETIATIFKAHYLRAVNDSGSSTAGNFEQEAEEERGKA
jgi:transglutaminase-like putative cysteine protease